MRTSPRVVAANGIDYASDPAGQFALDGQVLVELKEQLIEADKDGKMLVWTGDGQSPSPPRNARSQSQTPASYTPQHLVERILAERAAMKSRGASDGERKTLTMWQSQPIKP